MKYNEAHYQTQINKADIEENRAKIQSNLIGWKIATILSSIALVYSIFSNNQQEMSIESMQEALYTHITKQKIDLNKVEHYDN